MPGDNSALPLGRTVSGLWERREEDSRSIAYDVTAVQREGPEVVRVLSDPCITLGRNGVGGRQEVEKAPGKMGRQDDDLATT